MGTNARLFWILSGFFIFSALLYTGWSLLDHWNTELEWWQQIEWVGTLGILLSGAAEAAGRAETRSDHRM